MEKHAHLQSKRPQIAPQAPNEQQQYRQTAKIGRLGGVHLYNEDYKRHLCNKSSHPNQKTKYAGTNQGENLKNEQEQYMIQHQITDFLQHREQHKININSVFNSEIQNIIHNFKTSSYSTNRFLEEHQNKNEPIDNLSVFSFEQLFQLEKNKNRTKYTKLMDKVLEMFKEIVVKQVNKMRVEERNKNKDKEKLRREYATQTFPDHQNDLLQLKKQLQRKDAQYNALYEYKRNMINEGANIVKNYQIKCQYQQSLIAKLENQVASKNLELRGLQTSLKQTQQRLFNRIMELQKLYAASQAKQSLSSIKQMGNPYDLIRQNQALNNFLAKLNSKKKRYKKRAQSILSVTQSLFSTLKDKDDIIASMADLATKSMREIDFGQLDDQYLDELQKFSKNTAENQNLFKILEVYHKSKNRTSIQKGNKKGKNKISTLKKQNPQRNSSLLAVKVDKQYYPRSSLRQQPLLKSRVNSKQKRQKVEQSKFPPKKLSKHLQTSSKDHLRPKISISRKQSIDRKQQTPLQRTPMPSAFKQKPSMFKVSIKEIPAASSKVDDQMSVVSQNPCNQSRKKLKKGVSFQVVQGTANLSLHSLQVNICINNKASSKGSAKTSTCENIYTNASINEKPIDCSLQGFDKRRFSKNKLMKTKMKQHMHKKVGSTELQSHNFTNIGWNSTSNNDKTILSRNSTTSNFYRATFNPQNQRFSCHTSQEKINPFDNTENRSKSRNSFSRMQRSTVTGPAENQKEMKVVKQMALKSKSKAEYHQKLINLHKQCGQNCEHIKRYLEYFDKCRQHNKKQNLKLNIQNLNNNLRGPLPTIRYDPHK